ncbi:MAG: hypothetical protein NT022_01030 [Deltaproteobacteria bacterium]|nr:hypothetical protein [Deltaproteobacteria bacterium]
MKRISMMLMLIFVISLVPLLPVVDSASAATGDLYVAASPNPTMQYRVTTLNIIAADEESKVKWGTCEFRVYFGDGTGSTNIYKLTSQAGSLATSITHKYSKYGTFTIGVIPVKCATGTPIPGVVKTSVKVVPAKQQVQPIKPPSP